MKLTKRGQLRSFAAYPRCWTDNERGRGVKTRRFFLLVWRIDAILLLMMGVLAVAVLSYAAFQIYRDATRTRQVSNVVNVAGEQIDKSKVELGRFEPVAGSSVLRAPLQIEQQYGFSSGSKETSSVQNFLFYDPADGSSRWLAPGNKGLFLAAHELPEREYVKPEKPVVAVVYELVDSDTTGDQRLTASDAKVIAVSNPGGSRFTRLLSGVQEVNGCTLTPGGRILVLYTSSATLRAAEIDVETQRIVRDSPLEPNKTDVAK
jgi:hypothetical protein